MLTPTPSPALQLPMEPRAGNRRLSSAGNAFSSASLPQLPASPDASAPAQASLTHDVPDFRRALSDAQDRQRLRRPTQGLRSDKNTAPSSHRGKTDAGENNFKPSPAPKEHKLSSSDDTASLPARDSSPQEMISADASSSGNEDPALATLPDPSRQNAAEDAAATPDAPAEALPLADAPALELTGLPILPQAQGQSLQEEEGGELASENAAAQAEAALRDLPLQTAAKPAAATIHLETAGGGSTRVHMQRDADVRGSTAATWANPSPPVDLVAEMIPTPDEETPQDFQESKSSFTGQDAAAEPAPSLSTFTMEPVGLDKRGELAQLDSGAQPVSTASGHKEGTGIRGGAALEATPTGQGKESLAGEETDVNTARIARGLQSALAQRGGTVTLRLQPPELGLLKIQMEVQEGLVRARFITQTEDARGLLTQEISQLKTALEKQGLVVDRLEVQQTPPTASSSQTQQQTGQEAGGDGRSRGGFQQQTGAGQERGRQQNEPGAVPRDFREQLVNALA